jgi:hypothetical protein
VVASLDAAFDSCLSGRARHLQRIPQSFTGRSQVKVRMRHITNHEGDEMSDYTTKDRSRKLMMLGGLGLGLAMLGRKRRWRRYAMGQMMGGGGPWGRFGGYGHGGPSGPQQTFTLPPFIEATLKAWHDRAHGTVPPAETATGQSGTAQV